MNMNLEDLTELFTKADNVGETDKTRRKKLIMNLRSTGDLSDDDVAHLFHIYDLGDA